MLKNFLMKKMLQSKMKGVPQEQQEKILKVIEQNPEFFQKIASEIQAEMKAGKDQMSATMSVMQKYQSDLQKMM